MIRGGARRARFATAGDGQYRDNRRARGSARGGRPRGGRASRFPRVLRGARQAPAVPPLWSAVVDSRATEDPAAAWQQVRSELQASLPAATFDLWLEPLRAVGAGAETLYLTGPKRIRTWVERRYLGQLEAALRGLAPGLERIVLVDDDSAPAVASERRGIPEPLPVDASHSFDRFVIGPGSRFAHAAALAVAELPGEAYNPLFLHGPPGLGKTHLLGAIAGYLRDNHPELTVHYTTAERFTSEFVAALRSEGPERFKERYRGLDALLIDDVQVLEGKPRTEEEFVHTFNALFAAGKQIVLSSDRPPEAHSRLEQRLRDRFEWGLTVEMEPPDLRTRVALLWRFADDAVEQLPQPDVLHSIASRVPGNVRRLEGALTRVLAVSSVFDEPLAAAAVSRALPSEQGPPAPAGSVTAPSVAAIQDAVGAVLGVPRAALLSTQRTPRVARARQLAMFLARELTPLSLAQIAREFGRDHSTVLHALKAVEARNQPGSDFAGDIHKIRAALGQLQPRPPAHPGSAHDTPDRPQP